MDQWKAYLKMLEKIPRLSEDEEKQLVSISLHSGDSEARNKLLEANLFLAAGLTYVFKKRLKCGNLLTVEDVFQEASLKLWEIIIENKYDPCKGVAKFSTYAAKCMWKHLSSCISQGSFSVHIPESVRKKFAMLRTEDKEIDYNYEITASMLVEKYGLKHNTAVSILNVLQGALSINDLIGDNDVERGYFIPDTISVEDESTNRTILQEFAKLLLDKTFTNINGNTRPKVAYWMTACRKDDMGCLEINIENTYPENVYRLRRVDMMSSLDEHLDALTSQIIQEGCRDKTLFRPEHINEKGEKEKSMILRNYALDATKFLDRKLKSYNFSQGGRER